VADWLRSLGPRLALYGAVFQDELVDGSLLLSLSEDDLKSLGVGTFRDRRTLSSEIKKLKSATQTGTLNRKLSACLSVLMALFSHFF